MHGPAVALVDRAPARVDRRVRPAPSEQERRRRGVQEIGRDRADAAPLRRRARPARAALEREAAQRRAAPAGTSPTARPSSAPRTSSATSTSATSGSSTTRSTTVAAHDRARVRLAARRPRARPGGRSEAEHARSLPNLTAPPIDVSKSTLEYLSADQQQRARRPRATTPSSCSSARCRTRPRPPRRGARRPGRQGRRRPKPGRYGVAPNFPKNVLRDAVRRRPLRERYRQAGPVVPNGLEAVRIPEQRRELRIQRPGVSARTPACAPGMGGGGRGLAVKCARSEVARLFQ